MVARKIVYWFIGTHLGSFSCSTVFHTVDIPRMSGRKGWQDGEEIKKTTPGMAWHALIRLERIITRTRNGRENEAGEMGSEVHRDHAYVQCGQASPERAWERRLRSWLVGIEEWLTMWK